MSLALRAAIEHWPIAGSFRISRGAKTEAAVVVATINDGAHAGRGECVPYARYGETVEGVLAAIEAMAPALAAGLSREDLAEAMPAGAARAAIDCALWDLEAKRRGRSVADLAAIGTLRPLETAFTLSLGSPDEMAKAAAANARRPLLKIKLGGSGDPERILAVRHAAPQSKLIIDANEGWQLADFQYFMSICVDARVDLVEQPLPADADDALSYLPRPVPVCADESLHTRADLERLAGLYDAVNIKLDKTGGLTEALALAAEAEARGLTIMVGCMVGTSLAMAPAFMVAQRAAFVDLDGPLLLARDRDPGFRFDGSLMYPPDPELWG
ncbi:MAG: N-acetyl-D-Glu racemase DgcA [Hyphomicrobiales bacterium]